MSRPAKTRVSSHDVARHAGVSQSTVSLVLSGRADTRIPEPTRQRVLEAARVLNYTRNAAARALVTGRTHRIGIVLSHPHGFRGTDSYHSQVLDGVIEGVLRLNYNLLLHTSRYPDWRTLHGDILSGSADGVLMIGHYPDEELTNALLESSFPMVIVSSHPDREDCYAVDCDNEQGGYLAFAHLLKLGHRRIAVTEAGRTFSWIRERLAGAARACVEFGLSPEETLIPDISDDDPQAALRALYRIIPHPTALVCFNETTAQAVAEAAPAFNLRIPDDLSIVSFNSTEVSARARPPLTSVWQPLEEIGTAAVELLIDRIEGRDVPPGVRRFAVKLDTRDSTAPPPDEANV